MDVSMLPGLGKISKTPGRQPGMIIYRGTG